MSQQSAQVIFSYLTAMNEKQASDLYLTVGKPPTLRVENGLVSITEQLLTPDDIHAIVSAILTTRQIRDFDRDLELNTSLDIAQYGRFRVNLMQQRQSPALVIRRIISKIPSFSDLRLPKIFEELSLEKRGLVLVTGMTGSGKSTSLAAMVDYRNEHEQGHIITIEDPIEYFHEHKKSVVTQREVGVDTQSYQTAMKNALRQRPDVILVGEIRDREVMEQALMISETGHLCLATIHTNNAYQAIERVVNLFPDEMVHQARLNLSLNLKAIVSQRLLPGKNNQLVPAVEVMLNQALIRDLILKGEINKMREVMEQNKTAGMRTFDQSILKLFMDGVIDEDVAVSHSDKPSDMKIKVRQAKLSEGNPVDQETLSSVDTSVISFRD